MSSQVQQLSEMLARELGRVVVGAGPTVPPLLIALIARGHVLVQGVPGLGKTLLAKTLARTLGGDFKRIQGTADLMPSDIIGVHVFDEAARNFVFRPGPLFADVVLVDEINRAGPKTQSALLEAMEERQVSIERTVLPLPPDFLVLATQNPREFEGTYPLPESQLDRFLMRVRMGYPDAQAERQILRSEAGLERLSDLHPVLTGADVVEMQHAVKNIRVDDSLVDYALEVVRRTRESEFLSLGVSPRGSQALYRAAQAMAFLEGRSFCTPDDLKPLIVPVFAHRVVVNGLYASTLKKSEQSDQVLRDIVENVQVPV